nr:hypothetical protein K09E3.3 - Caenorhabditis elegans [Caenorhabditis elegans]
MVSQRVCAAGLTARALLARPNSLA